MNWQTGTREATTGGTSVRTVGTLHVEEYVEDLAACRTEIFSGDGKSRATR